MDIIALEEEIVAMEAKLERSRRYLEASLKEEQALSEATSAASENVSLTSKVQDVEPGAQSMEQGYVTLKGVSNWQPGTVNDQELSFHYIGSCPKACLVLSFPLIDPNHVALKASIKPELFLQHGTKSFKRPPTVASFLQHQVSNLCNRTNQHLLDSPKQIGSLLRTLEWQLGRMEHTASELASLIRRYHAVLQLSDDSSVVQLEVEFAGRSGSKMLRAIFDITDAYPFAPLSVCLDTFEEKVDVESMRKMLIKNAKPGCGYLSRTCGVIEAFTV